MNKSWAALPGSLNGVDNCWALTGGISPRIGIDLGLCPSRSPQVLQDGDEEPL